MNGRPTGGPCRGSWRTLALPASPPEQRPRQGSSPAPPRETWPSRLGAKDRSHAEDTGSARRWDRCQMSSRQRLLCSPGKRSRTWQCRPELPPHSREQSRESEESIMDMLWYVWWMLTKTQQILRNKLRIVYNAKNNLQKCNLMHLMVSVHVHLLWLEDRPAQLECDGSSSVDHEIEPAILTGRGGADVLDAGGDPDSDDTTPCSGHHATADHRRAPASRHHLCPLTRLTGASRHHLSPLTRLTGASRQYLCPLTRLTSANRHHLCPLTRLTDASRHHLCPLTRLTVVSRHHLCPLTRLTTRQTEANSAVSAR